MKNKKFLSLALIAACAGTFFAYRVFDGIRTDTKAPEIHIASEIPELSVHAGEAELLTGITATDNRDGDVSDSMVVENVCLDGSDGTAQIAFAAFDRAGNVAKAQRTVRFTDYTSPVFSLTEPLILIQNTSPDILSMVRAADALDGDISHRIRATVLDEGNLSTLGEHDVRFTVTNSMGETRELTLPVKVYDPGQYSARVTLTAYLTTLPKGSAFQAKKYLNEFTYANTSTALAGSVPAGMELKVSGEVNTAVPGVYAVDYLVSNSYATGYTRLIVVVEG